MLGKAGVDYSSVVEKHELVKLLEESHTAPAPAPASSAAPAPAPAPAPDPAPAPAPAPDPAPAPAAPPADYKPTGREASTRSIPSCSS